MPLESLKRMVGELPAPQQLIRGCANGPGEVVPLEFNTFWLKMKISDMWSILLPTYPIESDVFLPNCRWTLRFHCWSTAGCKLGLVRWRVAPLRHAGESAWSEATVHADAGKLLKPWSSVLFGNAWPEKFTSCP